MVTWYKHIVSAYTGLSFNEIQELSYYDYLVFRRDAFIHTLNQSDRGRQYLNEAWIFGQTEQDRSTMRALFGTKRKEGGSAE